ncbi:MAG: DDE-type integrase/transposase/recombinase [Bacteroidia bacterium]
MRRKPLKPEICRVSIRAATPDQYWHADVTEIKLFQGTKFYLYLVADNFSRKIFAWALSTQLRASIRMETIREAFLNSPKTIDTTLVVDGGTENQNLTVREYLEQPEITIKMVTAQVDVSFSNSIVEAVNRILKGQYIRPKAPPDGTALEKVVEWAVREEDARNTQHPKGSGPIPASRDSRPRQPIQASEWRALPSLRK